jgi:hypothetical protein
VELQSVQNGPGEGQIRPTAVLHVRHQIDDVRLRPTQPYQNDHVRSEVRRRPPQIRSAHVPPNGHPGQHLIGTGSALEGPLEGPLECPPHRDTSGDTRSGPASLHCFFGHTAFQPSAKRAVGFHPPDEPIKARVPACLFQLQQSRCGISCPPSNPSTRNPSHEDTIRRQRRFNREQHRRQR